MIARRNRKRLVVAWAATELARLLNKHDQFDVDLEHAEHIRAAYEKFSSLVRHEGTTGEAVQGAMHLAGLAMRFALEFGVNMDGFDGSESVGDRTTDREGG